jgi:hypothetical protein
MSKMRKPRPASRQGMTIREVLMHPGLALTPSEEKIVQLLLTDYPTSGLGSASSLARRAGVSDPTVVRLVMKLGYEGVPDFQAKLLAEVRRVERRAPRGRRDADCVGIGFAIAPAQRLQRRLRTQEARRPIQLGIRSA